jgi:hypothetical protein
MDLGFEHRIMYDDMVQYAIDLDNYVPYQLGQYEQRVEAGGMYAIGCFIESKIFEPLLSLDNIQEISIETFYGPFCVLWMKEKKKFFTPMKAQYQEVIKGWKDTIEGNYNAVQVIVPRIEEAV